jgi:hypothetical protein
MHLDSWLPRSSGQHGEDNWALRERHERSPSALSVNPCHSYTPAVAQLACHRAWNETVRYKHHIPPPPVSHSPAHSDVPTLAGTHHPFYHCRLSVNRPTPYSLNSQAAWTIATTHARRVPRAREADRRRPSPHPLSSSTLASTPTSWTRSSPTPLTPPSWPSAPPVPSCAHR